MACAPRTARHAALRARSAVTTAADLRTCGASLNPIAQSFTRTRARPPQKSYCYFMCVGEFGIAQGADAHLAVKPRAMCNRLSALNLQVLTAAQRPTTTRTLRSSSRRAWLAGVGVAGACARTRAFLGRAFEPHSAGGRAVRRAVSIEGGGMDNRLRLLRRHMRLDEFKL